MKKKINIFLVNKIYVGTSSKHFEIKRKLLNEIGYEIGKGTKIVGPIHNTATLQIGENCWIGKNLTINGNGKVIIGDGSVVAACACVTDNVDNNILVGGVPVKKIKDL